MEVIVTDRAPRPIGHYSQAIQVGNLLFLSGQISIDPKTEEVCLFEGDVARQTELILNNILAVLAARNLSLAHVVKTALFLTDISEFFKVNEVYARAFGPHKPARSTVGVAELPKGVAVEIEVIAQCCT